MEHLKWFFEMVDGMTGPARRAIASLQHLRGALTGVDRSLGQVPAAQHRAAGGFSAMESALTALGGAASAAQTAWSVAAGVGSTVLGLAASGASMVLDAARFREDTVVGMQTMLGTRAEAEDVFRQAQRIAQRTPMETTQVITAMRGFVTGGFRGNDLSTAIAMFADVQASQGNDAADSLQRLMNQLRGGRQFSQELMEMAGNAGVGRNVLFPELARMLHIDTTDTVRMNHAVEQAMHSHRVTNDMTLVALRNAVQGRYSGGGALGQGSVNLSNTLTGTISNLQSAFGDMLQGIDLAHLPGMESFKGFLNSIGGLFATNTVAGVRLHYMIEGVVNAFGSLFANLDANSMQDALMRVLDAVDALGSAGRWLWTNLIRPFGEGLLPVIRSAVPAIAALYARLLGLNSGGSNFAATALTVGRILGTVVVAAVMGLGNALLFLQNVFATVSNLFQIGTGMVDGIWTGIQSAWGGFVARFHGLVNQLPDVVRSALGIHSPSRVMMQLGLQTTAGFEQGVARGGAGIQSAMGAAVAPPSVPRGAGGRMSLQVHMGGIAVHGGGNAEEIGREVASQTASSLATILEQLALEAGVV